MDQAGLQELKNISGSVQFWLGKVPILQHCKERSKTSKSTSQAGCWCLTQGYELHWNMMDWKYLSDHLWLLDPDFSWIY